MVANFACFVFATVKINPSSFLCLRRLRLHQAEILSRLTGRLRTRRLLRCLAKASPRTQRSRFAAKTRDEGRHGVQQQDREMEPEQPQPPRRCLLRTQQQKRPSHGKNNAQRPAERTLAPESAQVQSCFFIQNSGRTAACLLRLTNKAVVCYGRFRAADCIGRAARACPLHVGETRLV